MSRIETIGVNPKNSKPVNIAYGWDEVPGFKPGYFFQVFSFEKEDIEKNDEGLLVNEGFTSGISEERLDELKQEWGVKNKLDLIKLEKEIDDILDKETPESLTNWLRESRWSKLLEENDCTDDILLSDYMLGFQNELVDKSLSPKLLSKIIGNKLRKIAYNIGILDAIVGDDVSSVDLQTPALILIDIKNQYYGEN